MNKQVLAIPMIILSLLLIGCSNKTIPLADTQLTLVNRSITSMDQATHTISLDNKMGDGLAVVEAVDFKTGTIEVDIKGENTPGRSFVGLAFNIQNDSTYEAIYFRPFNFQAEEENRRARAVQYISHPKHTWRFLRTNFEGQYEAAYGRQPAPDDWFSVKIVIDTDRVSVFDQQSNERLLSVKRIAEPGSSKIGLWMGNNSKGQFRNLKILK